MFVLDQHGFASINHTTITHVRCIVQNTYHTLLLVVSVTYELACFESLFLYNLQLNFVLILYLLPSHQIYHSVRFMVQFFREYTTYHEECVASVWHLLQKMGTTSGSQKQIPVFLSCYILLLYEKPRLWWNPCSIVDHFVVVSTVLLVIW